MVGSISGQAELLRQMAIHATVRRGYDVTNVSDNSEITTATADGTGEADDARISGVR
ncbi:hypothetical protein ABZS88_33715 [Streptomyces sp. NPDC005480]|uniref:hypothetical protein n=1 Tax=Streptomyces sp. NPDC005480 TaxID=3154880 RepID=UPI0033BF9411